MCSVGGFGEVDGVDVCRADLLSFGSQVVDLAHGVYVLLRCYAHYRLHGGFCLRVALDIEDCLYRAVQVLGDGFGKTGVERLDAV